MPEPRVLHFGLGVYGALTACGRWVSRPAGDFTGWRDLVTCKRCQKRLIQKPAGARLL